MIILYPYICKESETVTTFGWVDRNGNIFCNIENSTQLWDEFVVGFREYKEDDSDKCLWNEFMDKIGEQYEDWFAIQRCKAMNNRLSEYGWRNSDVKQRLICVAAVTRVAIVLFPIGKDMSLWKWYKRKKPMLTV